MKNATSDHTQTECVLCSEDWHDIAITYIPQLDNIPIENNYVDICLKEIKDVYFMYGKWKRQHQKSKVIFYDCIFWVSIVNCILFSTYIIKSKTKLFII